MAQRFLDAADHNRVAAERESMLADQQAMKEQIAELTAALSAKTKPVTRKGSQIPDE